MQVLTNVLDPIFVNVGSALVLALVGWGFKLLRDFLLTKIKNEKLRDALFQATNVVESVVMEIQQSIVSTLKKEGKFTKEAQQRVFFEAKEKITKLLPAHVAALLQAVYGDLDLWLHEQIEAAVYKNK
jgi:hypothetical protein